MSEAPQRKPNLYILTTDLDLLDSRDYGAQINTLVPEEATNTFLILSERAGCGVQYYPEPNQGVMVADLTSGQSYYTYTTLGEEATGGKLYAHSSFMDWNGYSGVFEPPLATWNAVDSPKIAIEGAFTSIRVEGPSLLDGPCGFIYDGSIPATRIHGSPENLLIVQAGLTPQWSLARMDLGATLLERTDLGGSALALTEIGDSYFVITKTVGPDTLTPSSFSYIRDPLQPLHATYNPLVGYTTIYYIAAEGYSNDLYTQYVYPTGGQVTRFVGVWTKPVTVTPGILPDLVGQLTTIYRDYFGSSPSYVVQIYANQEKCLLGVIPPSFAGVNYYNSPNQNNYSSSSVFGGGKAKLESPRTNIKKLNKFNLEIQDSGQWDKEYFTSGVINSLSLTRTVDDKILITPYQAIKALPHALKKATDNWSYVNTKLVFNATVNYAGIPAGCVARFYLSGYPITDYLDMKSLFDATTGYTVISAVAQALSIYFGLSNIYISSTEEYTIYLTGEYAGCSVPLIRVEFTNFTSEIQPTTSKGSAFSLNLVQGSPDVLTFGQPPPGTLYPRLSVYNYFGDAEFALVHAYQIVFTRDGVDLPGGPYLLNDLYWSDIDIVMLTTDTAFRECLNDAFGVGTVVFGGGGLRYIGTDTSVNQTKIGFRLIGTPPDSLPSGFTDREQVSIGPVYNFTGVFTCPTVITGSMPAGTRNGFQTGFDLAGLKPGDKYRLRSSSGRATSLYTDINPYTYGSFVNVGMTVARPLSVSFRIRYNNSWSSLLTFSADEVFNWTTQGGPKLKTAVDVLTGVSWTVRNDATGLRLANNTTVKGIMEIDPAFEYSADLDYAATPEEIKNALVGLGFTFVKFNLEKSLENGPFKFTYYDASHGLVIVDPKCKIKSLIKLNQDFTVATDYDAYNPYPPTYNDAFASSLDQIYLQVSSLIDYAVYPTRLVSFADGSVVTEGLVKYDSNVVKQEYLRTTVGLAKTILGTNRFEEVFVKGFGTDILVYDKNLVLKGTLTQTTIDGITIIGSTLAPNCIATDRHHNYYVGFINSSASASAYAVGVAKYNQKFQLIDYLVIPGTTVNVSGTNLICVNDHIILAKVSHL